MSLHSFLSNYKFDTFFQPEFKGRSLFDDEILLIEDCYFNNKDHQIPEYLRNVLNEWLSDPEVIGELGGFF